MLKLAQRHLHSRAFKLSLSHITKEPHPFSVSDHNFLAGNVNYLASKTALVINKTPGDVIKQ